MEDYTYSKDELTILAYMYFTGASISSNGGQYSINPKEVKTILDQNGIIGWDKSKKTYIQQKM